MNKMKTKVIIFYFYIDTNNSNKEFLIVDYSLNLYQLILR